MLDDAFGWVLAHALSAGKLREWPRQCSATQSQILSATICMAFVDCRVQAEVLDDAFEWLLVHALLDRNLWEH